LIFYIATKFKTKIFSYYICSSDVRVKMFIFNTMISKLIFKKCDEEAVFHAA